MFITTKERKGTCYLEFQFCKIENPIKANKVDVDNIENWKDDSLLISDEDFDIFYKNYGKIFECALFPNGEKGFFPYGINYYDKTTAEEILIQLKKIISDKYYNLIPWLEKAANNYTGFYILGI